MKKILSFIIATIIFSGCSEDFLDRYSLTTLADDTFWKTEDDALMALAGCYASLQDIRLYNSWWKSGGNGVVRMDYMSDDGWCAWNWMPGSDIARGQHSTTSAMINTFWRAGYTSIVRCNRVIEKVPLMSETAIDASASKQIVAEAKFIRALIYNLLSMTYENVPLITKPQKVEEAQVPKNDKSEVVSFILSDLEGCVEEMAAPGEVDWGRATKGAGYALLARINLYIKNWDDASSWAQKVIDLDYSLYPDFHGLFQSANEINDEVIFPVRFTRGPDGVGASFAGYFPDNPKIIYYQEALPNLGEDYFCIDGKPITVSPLYNPDVPAENRDPRMGATLVTNGSVWRNEVVDTYKLTTTGYAQRKYTEEQNDEDHYDANEDFYVFRLGEVLLMKAEALAEMGAPSTEIFDLINQLRDRQSVQMPHVTMEEVNLYHGGNIIDMVRHERRIETAFEGLRYFDLRRWGLLKERAVDFYMSYEKPKNKKLTNRIWKPEHVIWPIPQQEIDRNTSLEQNPGWN